MTLPTGTVTFVFTDLEGSTALLKRLGDGEYSRLLAIHRRLVRDIFAGHDGHEIDTQGDAFFYSFRRARQAVAAAVDLQRAHRKASWPGEVEVLVRIGLHTGEPAVGDEGYTGLDVVRAARIAAVGRGGQVLISDTTRAIAADSLPEGASLRALGERQLKDIDRPEPLFEITVDGVTDATDADEGPTSAGAFRARGTQREKVVQDARQRIEERVLASLEKTLGGDFPFGIGRPRPGTQPARPGPMSAEIERLRGLRDSGALSEEQYQRAVNRLLERPA